MKSPIAKGLREGENGALMPAADTSIIILAAGKGTRMRSSLAKVLHEAGGRTLIEHVIRAAQPLKPAQLLAVVGHQAEDVSKIVASLGAQTVLQQPQRGTGHAMQVARRAIRKSAKFAIVVTGDAPLLRTETLAALLDTHRRGEAAATILTAEIAEPSGYGRIVRDSEGRVLSIVEDGEAMSEQRAILEVNSSIYCFTLAKLWPCLAALRPDNAHHELYLTDAISMLRERNERVLAYIAPDANEVLGCNTRAQLADIDRIFRARKAASLMDSGVTIYLPETVIVDPDVTVGADSVVEPGVRLLGRTRVGANCRIGACSILFDMRVDDHVQIFPQSNLASARIAARAQIGPFARLRPGADIREGAHIGNFVEVKNTLIREGAKAMHLTYLGDASVGRESNIGAGTITCNYDGASKQRTEIGSRVFIGSDTALVAPVRVGDGAYVAAGSVITENVPPDALGIARGRQANKPGWARARRREAAAAGAKSPKRKKSSRPHPKSRRRTVRSRHVKSHTPRTKARK